MEFFRFPQTPHLLWLADGTPRDDKVMTEADACEFLAGDVLVEEKVDGANVGFSVDENGDLRVQNRGSILAPETCHGQFKPLFRWIEPRRDAIAESLFPDLMLFGEWCYAVHSVKYTRLPDWFLAFDVYDRSKNAFWSVPRRNELAGRLGLSVVPVLGSGRFTLGELPALLGDSCLTDGPAEGAYFRRDEGGRLAARAKIVRPAFTQAIDEHWSRRALRMNQRAGGHVWP